MSNILDRMVVKLMGDGSSFVKMMNDARKETKNFGKQITGIGKKITALTAPIALFSAGAVASFASFDDAMVKSTSIMGDLENSVVASMREQALALSRDGVTSARDLAEGYFFLASAGMNAEQQIAALPIVQRFATAGAFDMATATDLATDAQSALGLAVKDVAQNQRNLARVTDVLIAANTKANATAEQFSQALTRKAGAALRGFNKDIEEGVAVLAVYADQGVKGANAGEKLNAVLNQVSATAVKNADEFKKLGVEVFDSSGSFKNIADVVAEFEDLLRGMSDEAKAAKLEQLGLGLEVQNAINPLVGMSGRLRELEQELKSVQGITQEVADKQLQSFSSQTTIAKNQITAIAIDIGGVLVPNLRIMNELIGKATDFWFSLTDVQKGYIVTAGGVATATGPVLIGLGMTVGAVSNLARLVPVASMAMTGLSNSLWMLRAASMAAGTGMVTAFAMAGSTIAVATAIVTGFLAPIIAVTGIWIPIAAGVALVTGVLLGPGGLSEAFSFVLDGFMAVVRSIPRLLAFGLGASVALLGQLRAFVVTAIVDMVTFIAQTINAGIGLVAGAAAGIFQAALSGVGSMVSGIVSAFKAVAGAIYEVFRLLFTGDIVGAVMTGIGLMWGGFKSLISNVFNGFVSTFSNLGEILYKVVTLDFDFLSTIKEDLEAGLSGEDLGAKFGNILKEEFDGVSFDASKIDGLGLPSFGFGGGAAGGPEPVPGAGFDMSAGLTDAMNRALQDGAGGLGDVLGKGANGAGSFLNDMDKFLAENQFVEPDKKGKAEEEKGVVAKVAAGFSASEAGSVAALKADLKSQSLAGGIADKQLNALQKIEKHVRPKAGGAKNHLSNFTDT